MIHKNQIFVLVGTGFLLLIPLIAMQFTNEVNWQLFDFVVMGFLLISFGFMGDYLFRKVKNNKCRFTLIVLLILLFLLLWAEMAVGLFNSPISGS